MNLDHWLPDPALRIAHGRESTASPERLWEAAQAVRLHDAAMLGRLIRWRIPGTPADMSFDRLFRSPPFLVLESDQGRALVSGLVGRIWTVRRDYPQLADPREFEEWSERGTARVLFANWIESAGGGRAALRSEARVQVFGREGRLGLAAVRPLVGAFQHRIGTDGIAAAVRLAEERARTDERPRV